MIGLTRAQAELLDFIERFQVENEGVSPSFDDMAEGLGLKSKSGVHRLITALEDKGRLRRLHNRARALEIVPEAPVSALAVYPTLDLLAELARRSGLNRVAA